MRLSCHRRPLLDHHDSNLPRGLPRGAPWRCRVPRKAEARSRSAYSIEDEPCRHSGSAAEATRHSRYVEYFAVDSGRLRQFDGRSPCSSQERHGSLDAPRVYRHVVYPFLGAGDDGISRLEPAMEALGGAQNEKMQAKPDSLSDAVLAAYDQPVMPHQPRMADFELTTLHAVSRRFSPPSRSEPSGRRRTTFWISRCVSLRYVLRRFSS